MRASLLFIALMMFSMFSFAKFVSLENAMKAGKNFYFERVNVSGNMKYDDLKLSYFYSDNYENPSFYVFNVNGDKGYIIISADDAVAPVLGYNFDRTFNVTKMPPALAEILKNYTKQIAIVKQFNIKPEDKIVKKWSELLNTTQAKSVASVQAVTPLLKAEWDQSFPYNAQCPPATSGGDGGHYWVGCVAVAMGQIMKYYNFPQVGTLSKTSYGYQNGTGTNYTVNFAQQNYSWYRMPYTNLSGNLYPDETAKLLFHLGVAVSMSWGADGSGAYSDNVPNTLKNYFKYDHSIAIVSKSSYTESAWINLLKAELDLGRPLYYSGRPLSGAGHAWNCDGYQDDTGSGVHFHMNWGWGGSNNGFFLLTDLYTPASPGQPAVSLMEGQQVIRNIFPEAGYPENCNGQKLFTAETGGNFDDGSGNADYQHNLNCQYLIQPACGAYIHLTFDEFNIDAGDVVNVYDGPTTSSPLLASYHGGDVPVMLNSNGNKMLINFVTNGTVTNKGWAASYTVDYCKYGIIFTDPSGTFDDGSGTCEYRKSSNCNWTIDIPAAQSITLDFTSFALPNDADFVMVYKNDMSAANLVRKFGYQSGAMVAPTAPLTIVANKVIVKFFTNSTVNSQGWSIDYTSVLASGFNVGGLLNYANTANTPIAGSSVKLMNGTTQVSSTTTDGTGSFGFTNVVNGTYSLQPSTTIAWGGVSATDALKLKRHISGLELITEPIKVSAADVNNTGTITATDALKVQRRIAGLDTQFDRPDWQFEKASVGGAASITVNSANLSQNIQAICTGDVNGTYLPALMRKMPLVKLTQAGTEIINSNESIQIPVSAISATELGALQMFIEYPSEVLDIQSIESDALKYDLTYNISGNKIAIVWSSAVPINISKGEALFTINASVKQSVDANLTLTGYNEVADAEGNIIEGFEAIVPAMVSRASSVATTLKGNCSLENYPNPFNKETKIVYEIPESGKVSLVVYDIIGKEVAVLINQNQDSGKYSVVFNAEKLPQGIYSYKLKMEGKSQSYVSTKLMSITK